MNVKGFDNEFNRFPQDLVRNLIDLQLDWIMSWIDSQKNSKGFGEECEWFLNEFSKGLARNLIDFPKNFKGFGKEFQWFLKEF